MNEIYPSGNCQIFYDRISWALNYLNMSGLVDKSKRGIYELSQTGSELLKVPNQVDVYIPK